jgi:hypothetical protein
MFNATLPRHYSAPKFIMASTRNHESARGARAKANAFGPHNTKVHLTDMFNSAIIFVTPNKDLLRSNLNHSLKKDSLIQKRQKNCFIPNPNNQTLPNRPTTTQETILRSSPNPQGHPNNPQAL